MTDQKIISKAELKAKDFVPRGKKSSSPLNTSLFLGMRILDCFVQYFLLSGAFGTGLITFLGGNVIPPPEPLSTGIPLIDNLGLSAYRLVLFTMLCTTAAKHIWFATCVTEEAWTVQGALGVGTYNITCNTLNNLLFLCAETSATRLGAGETMGNPFFLAGVTLFVLGIGAEWQCEIHRKAFKKDPRNKGKAFTKGLFAVVRHPNYSGYTLWRGSLGLATSGLLSGSLISSFFLWDFWSRAIPALDEYCSKRYGAMWVEYKKKTPYRLIPFVV
ncbi:Fc.00g081290.m01.CDS01 [Cosmosporella sp. VM-42]